MLNFAEPVQNFKDILQKILALNEIFVKNAILQIIIPGTLWRSTYFNQWNDWQISIEWIINLQVVDTTKLQTFTVIDTCILVLEFTILTKYTVTK